MGKLSASWRATQELAHVHWIASSLLGGTMMTAALEIVTDAPLELTLSFGCLIACGLAGTINAVSAFKADAKLKHARASYFTIMATERAARRAGLISQARQKISEHDQHNDRDFLQWIENSAVFLALRPHLNAKKIDESRSCHGVTFHKSGRFIPDQGKEVFIGEIERLARLWDVD